MAELLDSPPEVAAPAAPPPLLLLAAVGVIATCGLIYELIAGTLASYLLGDSVTQFSTIIGAYLFAMGIGSWLSKFLDEPLLKWFIRLEILVGIVGGCMAPVLFVLFEYVTSFRLILYSLVGLTGVLVGLEIPLLMRILEHRYAFKDLVARVFTFDYIGALLASLVFPLVLVPQLGLIRTSLLFGALNLVVAAVVLAPLPRNPALPASLHDGHRGGPARAGHPVCFRQPPAGLHRNPGVSGPGDLQQKHALPAHRPHPRPPRPAFVSQRQPAVQLGR
jgi:spermidine synthase